MNLREFLLEMIQFLVFIPAAVICYLPMKNQLKFSGIKLIAGISGIFCFFIPMGSLLHLIYKFEADSVGFFMIILFFVFYQFTLKTDFFRSFAVFVTVCVLSAFPANFAYVFDAWLHPQSTSSQFSWQAAAFQTVTACVLTALLAYPLRKWGSKLIDNINVSSVWYSIIAVSSVFLLLSIEIIPHNYSTLYVGRCFPIYITILTVLLIFLILLYTAIYQIAMGVMQNAKLNERIHFFEMQESQYLMQKKYIEETSKHRHDYRQSIFTLKQLADDDNIPALKKYLDDYSKTFPQTEVENYCRNNAVNALLNYYSQQAHANKISLEWEIDMPDNLTVSEPELCSLLGNLIENALDGCMTVSDEKKRWHCLSVTLKNKTDLYIVSTNSFNGVVKLNGSQYLSIKRCGNGIGIHSMKIIAEKYNGIANFYHSPDEFFSDIMLKMPKE